MLFNSFEFMFGFLPVTLACFYFLGRFSRSWALGALIAASLFFYAWWRPLNVALIAPSILINFVLACVLRRLGRKSARVAAGRLVLAAGIVFNVAFLAYFKYRNFFAGAVNETLGTHIALAHIILPLGISFITFQKIAFLIDVHARRVESFTLRDYCLFVLFFPQLIAGPIVHYREMMPQFLGMSCRFNGRETALGMTLFFFGLFKKVVLADGIAPLVSMLYNSAGSGAALPLLPAWMAAIGFTLQIYFDFSGYTDMALGLGRLFGVRLPPNFNSPLKASSIIDFWLRWHMTLTRFLTAYLYNPLVLALTRRRLARGKAGFGGRNPQFGAFVHLLVMPTLLTMLISGLWHGAGYLFLIWGLLHGTYLSINHAWRVYGVRKWKDRAWYALVADRAGFVLTFVGVAVAMVFFRSATLGQAMSIVKGLTGANGVGLPPSLAAHLGPLARLFGTTAGVGGWESAGRDLGLLAAWIAGLLLIALLCPNTLQMLASDEAAVKLPASPKGVSFPNQWTATLPWAVVTSVVAAVAVVHLSDTSEFLYWQF